MESVGPDATPDGPGGDAWSGCGEPFGAMRPSSASWRRNPRTCLRTSEASSTNSSVERGNDPHETADTNGHGALRQGRAIDPGRWGRSLSGRTTGTRRRGPVRQANQTAWDRGGECGRREPTVASDSSTSTDVEEDASFEAPWKVEEARTPGEQPALTHPSRSGLEAGAGQVLQHPGDQAKGASPGRRSWGEWTVAARRPGVERRNAHAADRSSRLALSTRARMAERPTRRVGRNPVA